MEMQKQAPTNNRFLGINGTSWLAAWIFYSCVLIMATHTPDVSLPDVKHSDKWIHTIAYFLMMSIWSGWCMTWKYPGRGIRAGLMILTLFAGVDELTQPMFNRHADIYDWSCDCIGILLSGGLFGILLYARPRSH